LVHLIKKPYPLSSINTASFRIRSLGSNTEENLPGVRLDRKTSDNFENQKKKTNKDTDTQHEIFADDINDVMEKMLSNAIKDVEKPIPYMEKNDKIKVIEYLDKKGAFMIKGAVDHTAEKLNVSRYTIYNYLKEVENNK